MLQIRPIRPQPEGQEGAVGNGQWTMDNEEHKMVGWTTDNGEGYPLINK
jgi:hypothetical protein